MARSKEKPCAGGTERRAKTLSKNASASSRRRASGSTTLPGMQSAVARTGAATTFLKEIFGGRTKANVFISSYANDRGDAKTFPPRDIIVQPWRSWPETEKQIAEFVQRYDIPGRAVYVGVNPVRGKKRNGAEIAEYNALAVDIDFHGIVEDEATIRNVLRDLKYQPSVVVFSGHGLHAYWLFTKPLGLEHAERVLELLKLLAAMLAGDKSAAELVRVLRLPGSHNSKGGENIDVAVVEELSGGKTYSVDVLGEWIDGATPLLNYKPKLAKASNESGSNVINLWQAFAREVREQSGIDVTDELDQMVFHDVQGHGIDITHMRIIGLMVRDEVPVEECLQLLRAPTKRVFERGRLSGDGSWREKEFLDGVKAKYRWIMKREDQQASSDDDAEETTVEATKPTRKNDFDVDPPGEKAPAVDPFDPFNDVLAPDLPRGALPELIENVAFDEGRRMGVDPGVLAMSMLTMCAGIIPDQLRLKVKKAVTDGWYQSARAWTGIVGTASTKKSAGMTKAVKPVRDIDDVIGSEYDAALAQYKADKAAKEENAEPPIEKRVMIANITPEKISTLQAFNPQGLIYACDELVSIFGNLDRYSSKSGGAGKSARGMLLSSFDGLSETTDREGRKAPRGKDSGISIFGGIQPGVISSLVDEGSQNDGLVNRFNFVYAKSYGNGLDIDVDHPFTEYDDLIENLHERMPLAHGADFHFSDTALQFKEIAFNWINIQIKLAEENNDQQLASHLGKWENIFVRYCLLFHVIDNWSGKQPKAISQETVKCVDRLMRDYLIPHSVAFYKALGSDEETDQLKRACKHILISGKPTISVRELQRFLGRHKSITSRDMERVGSKLQTWDWLVRIQGKRNRRRPPDRNCQSDRRSDAVDNDAQLTSADWDRAMLDTTGFNGSSSFAYPSWAEINSIQWSVRDEVFTKFEKLIPGFKAEIEATKKRMKADFEARRKANMEGKR